jgi:formylglycine-generating enzyme required for sulfatase activity
MPPAAHTRVDAPIPTLPGAVPQWDQPPARPRPPAGDKKNVVKIISAVVAVAVIGAAVFGLWWYAVGGSKARPAPAKVEAPVPQPPVPPQPTGPPPPPEGMVRVDGGTVTIGRNVGDPLEQPAHSAAVEAFFIDRTEVTNAEYKKFLDATGHPAPPSKESRWIGTDFPPGEDKLPVVWVTWQDATAYAEWRGKRLPTEIEWEAAARGADARTYPWGNQWKQGAANIGVNTGKPAEVGSYSDSASPSGALDLIGNVWEWTADEISVYAGGNGVIETEPGKTYRVIRGGAFDGDRRHSASYRGYQDASMPYPKVGFRCAKSAK